MGAKDEEEDRPNTFLGFEAFEFNGMAIPGYIMEILRRHRAVREEETRPVQTSPSLPDMLSLILVQDKT